MKSFKSFVNNREQVLLDEGKADKKHIKELVKANSILFNIKKQARLSDDVTLASENQRIIEYIDEASDRIRDVMLILTRRK